MKRLRYYAVSLIITAAILIAIGVTQPIELVLVTLLLAVLEVSFSFDNAIINASVLARMSRFWQILFMYVGIFIAVGVVRFVLPIVIVMATAGLGFGEVLHLALQQPKAYAEELESAEVQVSVIGGIFLLMIFLRFLFDGSRDRSWIGVIEKPLGRIGLSNWILSGFALLLIIVIAATHAWSPSILIAGIVTLGVFMLMDMIDKRLGEHDEKESNDVKTSGKAAEVVGKTGLAGFSLFAYLEFQDAAFSLDGVSGAFAISSDVVVIAAGLGIGALFVRSMTVEFVATGRLSKLRYLEHGAHWAIGALALCILLSIYVAVPSAVTGLVGITFIAISWIMSVRANRHDARALNS